MDRVLAATDLAVCRVGGTTVAELAVVGVPSVLVPFPLAPRDHQTANAMSLVRAGGAVLVADDEVTTERLATELARSSTANDSSRCRRPRMGSAIPTPPTACADWCSAMPTDPRWSRSSASGSASPSSAVSSPEPRRIDLSSPRRVHLVAIGGAGMSAIAIVLREMGHR